LKLLKTEPNAMLDGRQNAAGLTGELLETGLFRSGLKINHLRLILAIDDHRRISAAADSLGISQPAASRMLAEIEAIVKAPICERVARGVELTRYGEALARRARTIFLELREAAREINELKTGSGGSVSLGSVTGPGLNLAVPAIRQVSTAYPGIEINVQIDNSNVLTRELLAARHDFIVGADPRRLQSAAFQPGRNRFRGGLPHRPGGTPAVGQGVSQRPRPPGLRLGVPAARYTASTRGRRQFRFRRRPASGNGHQYFIDHPDAVDRAEHQCDRSRCARRRQAGGGQRHGSRRDPDFADRISDPHQTLWG
jgi:DNA-binding transcriptional LysR family regulator